MLHRRIAAGVFALASGLAACGGSGSGGTQAGSAQNHPAAQTRPAQVASSAPPMSHSDTIAGLMADDRGTKSVVGLAGVTINAGNNYFEPSVLQGSAGQKVTLTIHNESATLHNFTLDAQHVTADIDPNKDVVVHVTFPSSGVLSFFCQYHKGLGMAGGLLVSGDKAGAPASSSSSSSSGSGSGWG